MSRKREGKTHLPTVFSIVLLIVFVGLSIIPDSPLRQKVFVVAPILLAIEILGLSVFAQIYSNSIHNADMADVNMYSYGLLSEATSKSKRMQDTYKKIAQGWLTASKGFRDIAKLRAHSFNLCVWSLIFLAVASAFAIFDCETYFYYFWLAFSALSLEFFLLALCIHAEGFDFKCFNKGFFTWTRTNPNLQRREYICKFICEHRWLDPDSDTGEMRSEE